MGQVTYPPYGEPVYVPEPYPGPPPDRPEPEPQPTDAVPPPSTGWALVTIAVITAVAAALPWATVLGTTVDGIGSDGTLTLLCALLLGVIGVVIGVGMGRLWMPITAAVAGGIVALVGLVDAINVSHLAGRVGDFLPPGAVSVGPGLWLTLFSGVAAVIVAAVAMTQS